MPVNLTGAGQQVKSRSLATHHASVTVSYPGPYSPAGAVWFPAGAGPSRAKPGSTPTPREDL